MSILSLVVIVQLLSHVQLFASLWTAACQSSLSLTVSQSLLKLVSFESVMPSNHLIFCGPLLLLSSIFPRIRVFFSESALVPDGQSTGASASASAPVLPMNIQGWFPVGLTSLISFLSMGLSWVFSSTTFESINSSVLSLLYGTTPTSVHNYWKTHNFDYV